MLMMMLLGCLAGWLVGWHQLPNYSLASGGKSNGIDDKDRHVVGCHPPCP